MSSTPWTPNDDDARRLLDDRIDSYDVDASVGLWERFMRWLNDALSLSVDPAGAGSFVIQAILIIAVAVLIFFVVRYFRPSASPSASGAGTELVDSAITAEEYFNNAQRYLDSGELDQAYIHAFRFMVRHAQQHQLVEVTPSTTATTFGWSLGAVLPSHRNAINDASMEFNTIVYGGSMPTRAAVTNMLQLAQAIQTAQPQFPTPHDDPARLIPR